MSKKCDYCGKSTVTGRSVSHAHNVTARTFEPNLRRMRAVVDGAIRTVLICARCLRSGKLVRPASRKVELSRVAADS